MSGAPITIIETDSFVMRITSSMTSFRHTLGALTVFAFLFTTNASTWAQNTNPNQTTRPRRVTAPTRSTQPVRPKSLTVRETRAAEGQLDRLGYWLSAPDGRWDESTRHALTAFQKVMERPRTGKLTRDDYEALLAAERPVAREAGPAHIEIDLQKQVLFVVDETGTVTKILPVSSGNGKDFVSEGFERSAVTPPGRFKVYNKIEGWRKSPLGMLYYPSYYLSGLAVHGSPDVPPFPDSHGCIRVPMFAAKELFALMPLGTAIMIYPAEELPLAQPGNNNQSH